MEDLLAHYTAQVASCLPEQVAPYVSVTYFPQVGYLIDIPADENTGRPIVVGEEWEYQFSTAALFHYKNQQMREMDNYYGDIYTLICGKSSHSP